MPNKIELNIIMRFTESGYIPKDLLILIKLFQKIRFKIFICVK